MAVPAIYRVAYHLALPALSLKSPRLVPLTWTRLQGSLVVLPVTGVLMATTAVLAHQLAKPGAHQAAKPESASYQPNEAGAREQSNSPNVRVDVLGDPLPAEAISRLGTTRLRHGQFTGLVRFTPDGNTLVSQGGDGIRTWEVATGKQIHFLSKEVLGSCHWQGISFSPDASQVVTGNDNGLQLWDAIRGNRLRILAAQPYFLVRYSPDGRTVVAAQSRSRNQLELFETATGRKLWSWSGVTKPLADLEFTPDGKTVVVAGWGFLQSPPVKDNTIRFLDAATGREQRQIDLGRRKPEKMALSADGTLLAVIHYSEDISERQVAVFELPSGRERFRLVQPGPGTYGQRFFSALAFTPDGMDLVTAGGEDGLIVWDAATGKELRRIGRRMTNTSALAFAPDGKRLAVARAGTLIRVLDWPSGKDLVPVAGHEMGITSTAITPDGGTVITASAGPLLIFWEAATGRELRRWTEDNPKLHFYLYYSLEGDGRTVIGTEDRGKTLRVWDLDTRKERYHFSLASIDKQPRGSIQPGQTRIVIGDRSATLHLIDSATGMVLQSISDPGLADYRNAACTPDGRTLVAFCDDHTAQVWDVATGKKVRQIGPLGVDSGPMPVGGRRAAAYASALSPDGHWIAYGAQAQSWGQARPGYLSLYDVATGQEVHRVDGLAAGAGVLEFSQDSRVLAWGSWRDPVIHLLETASGKERHTLVGHAGPAYSFTFSQDGKTLVSGSEDTTALVWDLTGRLAAPARWGQPLPAREGEATWADLASTDAARAYEAIRRLAAAPAQAIPLLQKQLRPVPAAEEKLVARLLADLGSGQFKVRQHAAQELSRLGEPAVSACMRALAGRPSAEVRRRLETLLAEQHRERLHPSQET